MAMPPTPNAPQPPPPQPMFQPPPPPMYNPNMPMPNLPSQPKMDLMTSMYMDFSNTFKDPDNSKGEAWVKVTGKGLEAPFKLLASLIGFLISKPVDYLAKNEIDAKSTPSSLFFKGLSNLLFPVVLSLFTAGGILASCGFICRILMGNEIADFTTPNLMQQEHQKLEMKKLNAQRENVRKETESPIEFFKKYNTKLEEGFQYLNENVETMYPLKRKEFLEHIRANALPAPKELIEKLQK